MRGLLTDAVHTGTYDYSPGNYSEDVQVCFVAGTPILMADRSTKPIEQIAVGDAVLCRDHENPDGDLLKRKVVRVFHNDPQATWKLTFAGGFEVRATQGHPFYVRNRGWVAAEHLQPGDECVDCNDNHTILVSKAFVASKEPVYNFEVEDAHTYFVGDHDDQCVLVHNECFDLTLVHRTTVSNAQSIIQTEFQAGRNGLRWFATPDATGLGLSTDAKTVLTFDLKVNVNIVDIPASVIKDAKNHANQKVSGLYPDAKTNPISKSKRASHWGALYNEYLRAYMENAKPEEGTVFRVPARDGEGVFYAFKEEGWQKTTSHIRGIAGEGADDLVKTLQVKNALMLEEGLKNAANEKWGNRIKLFGKWGGRTLVAVGAGISAYEIYYAEDKTKAITKEVGGFVGGWAGAKAGGYAGSGIGATIVFVAGQTGPQVLAPEEIVTVPLGGVIGGVIGGIIGGAGGFVFGRTVTENAYEWTFE